MATDASSMDTLRFTPRHIEEIEKTLGKDLIHTVQDFSMATLRLLVEKGLQMDTDQAYGAIRAYLDGGHDTFELKMKITEKLEEQGFLSPKLEISKGLKEALNGEVPFTNIGKKEKALPSK